MKYTTYFFGQHTFSSELPSCVAKPTQDFYSLEDARAFAQHAANARLFEVSSFQLESEDHTINEHWSRNGDGWKLRKPRPVPWQ
jgi:hypothetical protein